MRAVGMRGLNSPTLLISLSKYPNTGLDFQQPSFPLPTQFQDPNTTSKQMSYSTLNLSNSMPGMGKVTQEVGEEGMPRTSLFTYFEKGEWSQTGFLVQLISVKVIEGAGKYLFGNVLALNYRNELLSFYNRGSNDCEMLDGKTAASLCSPHGVLQILDELDMYVDLSTKDSEQSEVKEVGRGIITWQGLQPKPGIFSDLVRGTHGTTKVTYALIDEAVEAVVGIDIIGRSTKNLRAKIIAINEMFGKVVLFDGVLGDALLDKESIPLRNSVLAVSKEEGQKLDIRVLLGNDNIGKISRRATFYPKFNSYDTASDKGSRYGTLQMKVEWSAVPYSPERYLKKLRDAKPCLV